MRFKALLILTLTYLITAPVVFLVEVAFCNVSPVITARGIVGIYILFYAMTMAETFFLDYFRRTKPKSLLGAYMAAKGLRFFIAVVLIVCYGILEGPERVTFTLNVFICFIVTLILTTVLNMRVEGKNNTLSQ